MLQVNFKNLFDLNTDAIFIVDKNNKILFANKALYALTEYEEADLNGKCFESFFQCVHDNEELTEFDQRSQLICKNGSLLPILVRKSVMEEGIQGCFIVMKDMRTLDAIAENYLNSELRYRTIAENIQDVLILMDQERRYLYVSPSAKEMFQFDYRNINNRKAFFNIHPKYVHLLEDAFSNALHKGSHFTVKCKAWHEERQWIWTEITGKSVYDEHGKFKHMLLVARDITQQQKYEESLLHYAYNDVLTNLPNRRKLNELLQDVIVAHKEGAQIAVMVMDIDHFKDINDSYGHEIGDAVLFEFGKRIASCLPKDGIVGRYGGDEFVVILPYDEFELVEDVANNLVAVMQQPIEIQQTLVSITTSIGIALANEQSTAKSILKQADDALYQVKELGKNKFAISH